LVGDAQSVQVWKDIKYFFVGCAKVDKDANKSRKRREPLIKSIFKNV
jgi:hypothetical protein